MAYVCSFLSLRCWSHLHPKYWTDSSVQSQAEQQNHRSCLAAFTSKLTTWLYWHWKMYPRMQWVRKGVAKQAQFLLPKPLPVKLLLYSWEGTNGSRERSRELPYWIYLWIQGIIRTRNYSLLKRKQHWVVVNHGHSDLPSVNEKC